MGLSVMVWGKSVILKLDGLITTGISAWEVIYISASDVCSKADANIIKAARGIYMGVDGEIWLEGKFRNPNWTTATKPTWEAGETLWLSETGGEMTDTPPTTDNSIVQALGYIISIDGSETKFYFKPEPYFKN